jgi:hypothetical protein
LRDDLIQHFTGREEEGPSLGFPNVDSCLTFLAQQAASLRKVELEHLNLTI